MSIEFTNVADLPDPDDNLGRTYREVNNAKSHKFNIGDLVEVDGEIRLFIAKLDRDCDGTPVYSLTYEKSLSSMNYWVPGFSEEGMKLIDLQKGGKQ